MKKLFYLVLCFVLLAGSAQAGGGGKSVKQENSRQAGNSSIHFYDIEATDNHGYGRLVINTEKKTFTFIGQGYDYSPDGVLHLKVQSESGLFTVFAKAKITPSGNAHVAGIWEGELPKVVTATYYPHVPANGFSVENDGWFVIKVGCHYSIYDYYDDEPTWIECPNKSHDMAIGDIKYAHFKDLGVPLGASVKIKIYVALGPDQTHFETFTYTYGDYDPGYCYGSYTIEGTIIAPLLQYWSTSCESTPGKGDWEVIDLP